MKEVLLAVFASRRAGLRSRVALQLEVLALRHQLAVYQRRPTRARTKVADRLLWAWLSKTWTGWRNVLVFVQPSTVIAWQRRRFRDHWARLAHGEPGRPAVAKAVQDLIREMSSANARWGSPRIVGELAKLGIHVTKSTVEKYMLRPKKPPSPTWRAFLDNHVKDLVSVDFFAVPTVAFKVLFVFVVLAHARRRIVHFNDYEAADRSSGVRLPAVIACFSARASPHSTIRALAGVLEYRYVQVRVTWARPGVLFPT